MTEDDSKRAREVSFYSASVLLVAAVAGTWLWANATGSWWISPVVISLAAAGIAAVAATTVAWQLTGRAPKRYLRRRQGAIAHLPIAEQPVQLAAVLSSLVMLSETRDAHTGGHCQRVVDYSLALGAAYGLTDQELDELCWAALLHDIGKVTVPESILNKAGRLSDDELAEIRRHPVYGADLIMAISPRLAEVASIVRAHHERWDGLGYPARLAGEDIPLAARMLAIADVFEALTSERPYRRPLTESQALIYIRRGAGTQFDPRLVAYFERSVAGVAPQRTVSQRGVARVPVGGNSQLGPGATSSR